VALTWNGKKLDWTNVIYFGVIHAGALLAPWMFSWTALGLARVPNYQADKREPRRQ